MDGFFIILKEELMTDFMSGNQVTHFLVSFDAQNHFYWLRTTSLIQNLSSHGILSVKAAFVLLVLLEVHRNLLGASWGIARSSVIVHSWSTVRTRMVATWTVFCFTYGNLI